MAFAAQSEYSFRMKRFTRLAAIVFFAMLFACGSQNSNDFNPYTPIFTDPQVKQANTASADFTDQLLNDAVNYEPLLTTQGTQVHLGFWSGAGNHGSLVRLLDSINVHCLTTESSPNCAVWDEGATSSLQYPSYVTMLEEHWYDRGNATGGVVTIYGTEYTDPYTVTFAEADDIWGQYSERYADLARNFTSATGLAAKAWCFVEGARANRIFYTYELPELETLEAEGVVTVYFAKTTDADWENPDDWNVGTANAPTPVSADIMVPVSVENR